MDGIDDEDDGKNYNDEADESVIDNDEEDEVNAELDLKSQDNKDTVRRRHSPVLFVFIIEVYN